MNRNPWQSYRQIATQTATPAQLIQMLYDGAIRFLGLALAGFEKEDPLEFNLTIHNNITRAQAIIRELNASLNLEEGGEVAGTLGRLYDYFERRLEESNLFKRPDGVHEVVRRLTSLREAWAEMLRQQQACSRSDSPHVLATA